MKNKRFGDLDREGYSQVVEELTRCVIDKLEIATPVRNARIEFTEDNLSFNIDFVEPPDDDRWTPCQVALIR
jgi:hypothetical protein